MFQSNPEFQKSVDAVRQMLEELPFGKVLTYSAMTEAIGYDVLQKRYVMTAARKQAEEATGSLFEAVRGEGLKRIDAQDIPGVGLSALRRVRSTAKRGVERLATVRANDMTSEDAAKVVAMRSQLGAIAMLADGRKAVSLSPGSTNGQMTPEDALRKLVEGVKK